MSRSIEHSDCDEYIPRTPRTSPSRSETRAVLLKNYRRVPVLYVGESQCVALKRLNLEHVVPQSVLKSVHMQRAIDDPLNLQLSLASVNSKRKNYPFTFDLSIIPKNHERANFVDEQRRLFVPGECDWGFLSRTLLRMHSKWEFPLRYVTTCSHSELRDIASQKPVTAKECFRETIV